MTNQQENMAAKTYNSFFIIVLCILAAIMPFLLKSLIISGVYVLSYYKKISIDYKAEYVTQCWPYFLYAMFLGNFFSLLYLIVTFYFLRRKILIDVKYDFFKSCLIFAFPLFCVIYSFFLIFLEDFFYVKFPAYDFSRKLFLEFDFLYMIITLCFLHLRFPLKKGFNVLYLFYYGFSLIFFIIIWIFVVFVSLGYTNCK